MLPKHTKQKNYTAMAVYHIHKFVNGLEDFVTAVNDDERSRRATGPPVLKIGTKYSKFRGQKIASKICKGREYFLV